jgi:hypothetical protein
VNNPEATELKPERKRSEPLQVVGTNIAGHPFEKRFMLVGVLGGVRLQELPAPFGMLCVVSDRVEFVVSHHDLGVAAVNHRSDEFEDTELLVTSVNEVTDEDGLSVWMSVGTGPVVLSVAEGLEKLRQL